MQIVQVPVGFQTEPQLEASLSERSGKAAGRYLAVVQGRRMSTTQRGHPGMCPLGGFPPLLPAGQPPPSPQLRSQPCLFLRAPSPSPTQAQSWRLEGHTGCHPKPNLSWFWPTFIPPLSPDPLPAQRSQAANLSREIWGKTTNIQTRTGGRAKAGRKWCAESKHSIRGGNSYLILTPPLLWLCSRKEATEIQRHLDLCSVWMSWV